MDTFEVYVDGELVLSTPETDRPSHDEIDAAVEPLLEPTSDD